MHYLEKNNLQGLLMLVDFQKAFDSVSWDFLSEVLKFFNFGQDFKRWIDVLNKNVQASILQSGYLAEFFNIQRGCRQGDPIAPYLFLLCAQILYLMILYYNNIKGIHINNCSYKISQFANDTTIFLDGSKDSLLAALNTLEIYGCLSGLVVNTDKTKLVWLGKKKHSKDIIDTPGKLLWGTTEFDLLGIQFAVDLENIPNLNYGSVLSKINHLNQWRRRKLTPMGKITVIKTFIISSLNHIFTSIPSPNKKFITNLNSLMYSFIWDNKPDKVNRKQITNTYLFGALKMLDLELLIKSQKITWIERLLIFPNSPYAKLFSTLVSIEKLYMMEPLWSRIISKKISNPFWGEVLMAWGDLLDKIKHTKDEAMSCPLWHNPQISSEPLFFPHWYYAGVYSPLDLLDNEGRMIDQKTVQRQFNSKTNFLEYTRIKRCLKTYMKNLSTSDIILTRPCQPSYLKLLSTSNSGTRKFYSILNQQYNNLALKIKWNNILNIDLDENDWINIYKVCFRSLRRNDFIWFQFRLIQRILGTKAYLSKVKVSQSSQCSFCSMCDETICHLFTSCPKVCDFWLDLRSWSQKDFNVFIELNPVTLIFGYIEFGINLFPKNVLILCAKKYIFDCAYSNKTLSLKGFRVFFTGIYNDQKYIAKINNNVQYFLDSWSVFSRLNKT